MTLALLRWPVLVASFAAALASAAFGAVTETVTRTFPLTADGVLSLSNMNGDVEIIAWERNEVSLEAVKSARDTEALQRIDIVVSAEPTCIDIKTKHAKTAGGWRGNRQGDFGSVRYALRVPASLSRLKVETMNSYVRAEGVHGAVKIATMNGRITATGLRADANLETMNGHIVAAFDRLGAGQKVSLESMNGSCTIDVPADASARVAASTMNGRVHSDVPVKVQKASRRSLRGTLGDGAGSVEFDSMNGSLTLRARS